MLEFNEKEIFTRAEVLEIVRRSASIAGYDAKTVWKLVNMLEGPAMSSFDIPNCGAGIRNLHGLLKFNNILGKKEDIHDGFDEMYQSVE